MSEFIDKILVGDSLKVLKTLPDGIVDCCITSPPYWGLRDYGTAKWIGGDINCTHLVGRGMYSTNKKQAGNKGSLLIQATDICTHCGAKRVDNQLGQEQDFNDFIQNLLFVFNEIKRVLKPEGTLFVNLGDTYSGSRMTGIANKSLCMIPERFAIRMIDDGWVLRNQIIWHKPNAMPHSAKDRFTVDFEKIFFFVKQAKDYYFKQQLEHAFGYDGRRAIEYKGGNKDVSIGKHERWKFHKNLQDKGQTTNSIHLKRAMGVLDKMYPMRNMRTVWSISTKGYKDAHFAVYPEKLVERMINAGCLENGIVLDPFMGSGTTAVVAKKLNRHYLGIELNPEYVEMAEKRLVNELGLFL